MAITRFFTSGDQKGLFDNIDQAFGVITFDKNGQVGFTPSWRIEMSDNPFAKKAFGGVSGLKGKSSLTPDSLVQRINPNYAAAQVAKSKKTETLSQGYSRPNAYLRQETETFAQAYRRQKEESEKRASLLLNTMSSLNKGTGYNSFYNDEAIKQAFTGTNAPMTWEQYFKASQNLYEGELDGGKKIRGAQLFSMVAKTDPKQALNFLRDIENRYGDYMESYRTGATNFLGSQNNQLATEQAMTDTDPNRRQQVANYGVSGEPAPTGAAGWGRGNVQASEGFQQLRRRGWGQAETQGV